MNIQHELNDTNRENKIKHRNHRESIDKNTKQTEQKLKEMLSLGVTAVGRILWKGGIQHAPSAMSSSNQFRRTGTLFYEPN